MTLSLGTLSQLVTHKLARRLDSRVTVRWLANQAGHYLMSHHRWIWARRRPVKLSFKAPIAFTTATWTEATLTLTDVGAFASYTHRVDDQVTLSAGTSAILKQYKITAATANTLVLDQSCSATGGDLAAGDIAGEITFPYFELPTDFGKMTTIHASDSITREFLQSTPDEIQTFRSYPIENTSWYYWATTTFRHSGGSVVPIFELYPTPNAEELDWITIWYEAGFAELVNDNDKLTLPDWLENYYVLILRAFADHYERDSDLAEALEVLKRGPIGRAAMIQDGGTQSSIGPMRNGSIEMSTQPGTSRWSRSPVQPPS